MSFVDHSSEWVTEMKGQPDATFNVAHKADTSLEHFISRPVMIKNYSWRQNLNSGQLGADATDRQFNPWELFFQDARVKGKLDFFHLLRCKLHVKFLINGNPFFFGRAMCAYTPLHLADSFHDPTVTDNMAITQPANFTLYSQRPKVFLDPSTSQGGELILPYVLPANAMQLTALDRTLMGVINMFTILPLSHANGQTDGEVDVQVFAWASDVVMAVPTTHETQMGEYTRDGAISKPANAIAKAAMHMADLPMIRPYALAAAQCAGLTATLASALGFSRPPVLQDIVPYVPRVVGNLANTNAPETVQKLTMDVKQETTIDSRVVGLDGTDEMTIAGIASRESFLDICQWTSNAEQGSRLWNAEVSPVTWNGNNGTEGIAMPACCYAALPFKCWRGTLNYRFQVIASNYHKGRLRVLYDPVDFASTSPFSNSNLVYSTIIDLDKTRDFTIPIGWGSKWSMLEHRSISSSPDVLPHSTDQNLSSPGVLGNGIIRLEVLNELTSPGTLTSDVYVTVSICAGDDFEVFEPSDRDVPLLQYFSLPEPQCGCFPKKYAASVPIEDPPPIVIISDSTTYVVEGLPEIQMGEVTNQQSTTTPEENAPTVAETLDTMCATLGDPDTVKVYFGDPVLSLRNLCKRYTFHEFVDTALGPTNAGQHVNFSYTKSDFPQYSGYAPSGEYAVSGTSRKYNYVGTTILNYVTPAFITRRGGIRWKYAMQAPTRNGFISVSRTNNTNGLVRNRRENLLLNAGVAPPGNARNTMLANSFDNGLAGTAITPIAQNPVLEVEVPWYSFFRFGYARSSDFSDNGQRREWSNFHTVRSQCFRVANQPSAIMAYVAAAEDFNLAGYIGPPKCWFRPGAPPPPG